MLTVELTLEGETTRVEYQTAFECYRDLRYALDTGATCRLWCGDLLLSGRPIESSRALRDVLEERARAILRRAIELSDQERTTD